MQPQFICKFRVISVSVLVLSLCLTCMQQITGFITIFAAAFPLAPLLAFFANNIEMKIDAQALTGHSDPEKEEKPATCRPQSVGRTGFRRPVYQSADSIGAWNTVSSLG